MCLEEMLEDLLVMDKVVVLRIGKVCSLIVVEIFGSAVCMRFFLDLLACKVAQKSSCELTSRSLMILLIENCCVLDDAPTLLLLVRCCYLGSWWQVRSAVAVQRTCQARLVSMLPSMWTEGVSLYCLQDMTMM
jgi:hypothetical protein